MFSHCHSFLTSTKCFPSPDLSASYFVQWLASPPLGWVSSMIIPLHLKIWTDAWSSLRCQAYARCPGATLVQSSTISVGGNEIQYTSELCSAPSVSRRGLFDSPPLCILLGTCKPKPPPAPRDVCTALCQQYFFIDVACRSSFVRHY